MKLSILILAATLAALPISQTISAAHHHHSHRPLRLLLPRTGWNGYRGGFSLGDRTSVTRPASGGFAGYSPQSRSPLTSRGDGGYGGGGGGGYGGGGGGGVQSDGGYGGYGGGAGYGGGYGGYPQYGGLGWQYGYGKQQNYGATGWPAYGFYGGLLAPYLDGDFSYAYPAIPITEGDPYGLSGYALYQPKATTAAPVILSTPETPAPGGTGGAPGMVAPPGDATKTPTTGTTGSMPAREMAIGASAASGTSQSQASEVQADSNTKAFVKPENFRNVGSGTGRGFIRDQPTPMGQPMPGVVPLTQVQKANGQVVTVMDSGDSSFGKASEQAQAEQGATVPQQQQQQQFFQPQQQQQQPDFNGVQNPAQNLAFNSNGQAPSSLAGLGEAGPNGQFLQNGQFGPNSNINLQTQQLTFGGNGAQFPGSNNFAAGIGGPPVQSTFQNLRQQGPQNNGAGLLPGGGGGAAQLDQLGGQQLQQQQQQQQFQGGPNQFQGGGGNGGGAGFGGGGGQFGRRR